MEASLPEKSEVANLNSARRMSSCSEHCKIEFLATNDALSNLLDEARLQFVHTGMSYFDQKRSQLDQFSFEWHRILYHLLW